MPHTMLQAHRGVSTEYPENTLVAFKAAITQGYEYIELDPNYTADNKIVLLHDNTLNRTARDMNGEPLENEVFINSITYADALKYDLGIGFSVKFRGERIPLLEDVLRLAAEHGTRIKLDSKIEAFSAEAEKKLYELIDAYEDIIAITTARVEKLLFYAERFPKVELHYDGAVSEDVLDKMAGYKDRLTVWVPDASPLTSWVSVAFVSAELCALVKRYAKLGIWIIKDYESFERVVRDFEPDVVETTGRIKPDINRGRLFDMHVHSHNSHDSKSPIRATATAAEERGISAFAITDHCDTQYYISGEIALRIAASVNEVHEVAGEFNGRVDILSGVEIGEPLWDKPHVEELLAAHDYDVVIGSVHAVRYKKWSDPYSMLDLRELSRDDLEAFMDKYFDEVYDMLHWLPCDIMAHLTCPLRYINGKFGLALDVHPYEKKIEKILSYIIEHGIAMEVNTSGKDGDGGYYMPDEWIIQKYYDMGGYLITLGSDAHVSENIGKSFDDALSLLRGMGFRHYYYFREHINIQCAL